MKSRNSIIILSKIKNYSVHFPGWKIYDSSLFLMNLIHEQQKASHLPPKRQQPAIISIV